jgi:hypothetical protein
MFSPAIVVPGMSDRKLFSRTCEASSGRKGRKNEAAATLSRLPKFAMRVVRMYF